MNAQHQAKEERDISSATAVAEYSKTAAALSDLADRYRGVVFDVATRDGMSWARETSITTESRTSSFNTQAETWLSGIRTTLLGLAFCSTHRIQAIRICAW